MQLRIDDFHAVSRPISGLFLGQKDMSGKLLRSLIKLSVMDPNDLAKCVGMPPRILFRALQYGRGIPVEKLPTIFECLGFKGRSLPGDEVILWQSDLAASTLPSACFELFPDGGEVVQMISEHSSQATDCESEKCLLLFSGTRRILCRLVQNPVLVDQRFHPATIGFKWRGGHQNNATSFIKTDWANVDRWFSRGIPIETFDHLLGLRPAPSWEDTQSVAISKNLSPEDLLLMFRNQRKN